MELRAIYDQVRAHLLTQMKQSIGGDGVCAYRGDRGLKCAIGCLIPDEVYTPDMEGDVDHMLDLWEGHPFDGDVPFLEELQSIHDNNGTNLWKDKLDDFALKWNL